MITIITVVHAAVCLGLAFVILIQSGRGGGLTENFASAESMFGTQTNAFLIKSTTVLGTFFLVTCLSLAFLSSKRDESLMSNRVATETQSVAEQPVDALPIEASQQP